MASAESIMEKTKNLGDDEYRQFMTNCITSLAKSVDDLTNKRKKDHSTLEYNFDLASDTFDRMSETIYKLGKKVEKLEELEKLEKKVEELEKLEKKVEELEESIKRKRRREPEPAKKTNYISSLNKCNKNVKPWNPGMSKYRCVNYNYSAKYWTFTFHENMSSKKIKKEIEKDFEDVLTKLQIPFEDALRPGYSEKDDIECDPPIHAYLRAKYIDSLNKGTKHVKSWEPGMSKYRRITYNHTSKKWFFNFHKNFSNKKIKKEIEKDFEDVLTKLGIPFECAIRSGYIEKDDIDCEPLKTKGMTKSDEVIEEDVDDEVIEEDVEDFDDEATVIEENINYYKKSD
jgi:hypothetical protein